MKGKLRLFSSKSLLISFLFAIGTVCLIVYLVDVQFHRSVYYNSFLSLSILSLIFFLFLIYGLYHGFDIKPTIKRLEDKVGFVQSSSPTSGYSHFDFPDAPDVGDGIEGVIAGIILWIGVALLTILLLFFLETIIWAGILIAVGSVHWIFYRAMRLVLKRSGTTRGNLIKSIRVSSYYTVIYVGWIYATVYGLYLARSW
jgi:hypothetical protein